MWFFNVKWWFLRGAVLEAPWRPKTDTTKNPPPKNRPYIKLKIESPDPINITLNNKAHNEKLLKVVLCILTSKELLCRPFAAWNPIFSIFVSFFILQKVSLEWFLLSPTALAVLSLSQKSGILYIFTTCKAYEICHTIYIFGIAISNLILRVGGGCNCHSMQFESECKKPSLFWVLI